MCVCVCVCVCVAGRGREGAFSNYAVTDTYVQMICSPSEQDYLHSAHCSGRLEKEAMIISGDVRFCLSGKGPPAGHCHCPFF